MAARRRIAAAPIDRPRCRRVAPLGAAGGRSSVRGTPPDAAARGSSADRAGMSMLMSSSRRTCGIVEPRDRLDTPAPRLRRIRRLRALDLFEQHEVELGPARGSRRSSRAPARLADRQSQAASRRAAARARSAGGGTRTARRRCVAGPGSRQSSMLAPTMLTRPPAAARRSRRRCASASRRLGERAPQLTGLDFDVGGEAVGRRCRPRCRGSVRSARSPPASS